MEKNAEETRKCKLQVRNPGGNSSKNAKGYRLDLPPKWVQAIGNSPKERDVKLSLMGDEITIKKFRE